jgi:alpha-aminoadipic semialdehyde synthase
MYWDQNIPQFLTKEQAKNLNSTAKTKLYAIADISCDINGGVEFTSKATTIDKPFFYYDTVNMKDADKYIVSLFILILIAHFRPIGISDIQMMTIDNLPAQLPKDASSHFSDILTPILKKMIKSKILPKVIERATIIKDGVLVKRFKNLQIGNANPSFTKGSADQIKKILVLGAGYVAKPAIDYLSRSQKNSVIVGTDKLDKNALSMSEGKTNVSVIEIDISNTEGLEKLIASNDIVLRYLVSYF